MPGGKASGLTFRAGILAMGATAFMILGFASRGVKFGTESGTVPSMMQLSMLAKNLVTNLTILTTRSTFKLLPLLPCSIKLLFTELVEKLAS